MLFEIKNLTNMSKENKLEKDAIKFSDKPLTYLSTKAREFYKEFMNEATKYCTHNPLRIR